MIAYAKDFITIWIIVDLFLIAFLYKIFPSFFGALRYVFISNHRMLLALSSKVSLPPLAYINIHLISIVTTSLLLFVGIHYFGINIGYHGYNLFGVLMLCISVLVFVRSALGYSFRMLTGATEATRQYHYQRLTYVLFGAISVFVLMLFVNYTNVSRDFLIKSSVFILVVNLVVGILFSLLHSYKMTTSSKKLSFLLFIFLYEGSSLTIIFLLYKFIVTVVSAS